MATLTKRRRSALTVQVLRGFELPTQFALSIFVARALDASDFGTSGVFISVQTICLTVAAFGFDELLQRAVSRDRDNRANLKNALGRALRVRVLSCAFLGIGVAAVVVLEMQGASDLILPTILTYVTTAATLLANVYVSVAFSTYDVLVPLVASLSQWVIPLALSAGGRIDTVSGYTGALAVGALVRLAVTLLWAHTRGLSSTMVEALTRWRRPRLLQPIGEHVSLVIYNLNNQVLARHGDVIIAGIVGVSLSAIGAYGLAFQITSTANTFLMVGLGSVSLSRLSELADEPAGMGHSWRNLSEAAALIAAGPLAVLPLVAPEIVHILFGAKYPLLTPLILALCLSQWVNRITGGGTNIGALIARGDARYVARNSVFGAVTNIVLDVAGAIFFGIFGLVIATGIATAVVGVSNLRRIHQQLGARPPVLLLAALTLVVVAAVCATTFGIPALWRWVAAGGITAVWAATIVRTVNG